MFRPEEMIAHAVIYDRDLITVTARLFPDDGEAEEGSEAEEWLKTVSTKAALHDGTWQWVQIVLEVEAHGMTIATEFHGGLRHGDLGGGAKADGLEFRRGIITDDAILPGSALWQLVSDATESIRHAMTVVTGAFVRVPDSPLDKLYTWCMPDLQTTTRYTDVEG